MSYALGLTAQFEDDLKQLRRRPRIQDQWDKTVHCLQDDPKKKHTAVLDTKMLRRLRKYDVLKSDVGNTGYRIVWRYDGPGRILLHRIGKHDFITEQTGQAFHYLRFPFPELGWVNPMRRGDLGNRLFFLQDFQHDLGFLGDGIVFSHSSDYILFWPVFVSGFWGPL